MMLKDDFGISEQFPEGQISKMGKAAMKVIGVKVIQILNEKLNVIFQLQKN